MQEAAFDLDDFSEILIQKSPDDGDPARKKRKLGRASNKNLGVFSDHAQDRPVGCQIDTEGLFSEQMFPSPDDVGIELGMEMMRDRAINGLNVRALEQGVVIGSRKFQGRNILFEPAKGGLIRVTGRRQNRPSVEIG